MRTFWLVTLCAACGCGDNTQQTEGADVTRPPDATVDAAIAADDAATDAPVFQNQCDYLEQQDSTNDYEQVVGAEEDTPWGVGRFTPPTPTSFVICGNINVGHYDAATRSIDVDRYTFSVWPSATVTINFSGDEEIIRLLSSNYGSNSQVGVFLRDHATGATLYEGGFFQSDTATWSAYVPSTLHDQTFDLDVEAYDDQEDIFLSVPYAIKVTGS